MSKKNVSAGWVTFRPEIKVLDCTVRDGGLINNHHFEDEFIRRVYTANVEAGVDYMELGYKASKKIFHKDEFGAWKYCDEDDIRRIVGENKTALKLCAMADAERTDYHTDIIPKEKSVLNCIRVACYVHQIPTALDMIKDAHDKGYETTLNLMAISTVPDFELNKTIEVAAASPVDVLYLVDSFGSLYSEQIEDLLSRFLEAVKGTKKRVGIHTHNNLQLAFANTITGLIKGATMLDATIGGLGRGAGNCPMELLLGFLKNPKFEVRPIIQCVEQVLLPLQKKMDWGYSIPYSITGFLNIHPRDAMKLRESDQRDQFVAFFDEMNE